MRKIRKHIVGLLLCALLINPITVKAEDNNPSDNILGTAAEYNVFVEDDFTVTGADCPGKFAVGGNVEIPNYYTVGGKIAVVLNRNKIKSGNFADDVEVIKAADANINFTQEFKHLRETSKNLMAYPQTENAKVTKEYGNLTFSAENVKTAIFNFTIDEWNSLADNNNIAIYFNVPDEATVIINISGQGNINLYNGWGSYYNNAPMAPNTPNNKYVLFNVETSGVVAIGNSTGCLLAPNASVTTIDGLSGNPHFEGNVICKTYNGHNQFGGIGFDGIINTDKIEEPKNPEEETPSDNTPTVSDNDTPDDPSTPSVSDNDNGKPDVTDPSISDNETNDPSVSDNNVEDPSVSDNDTEDPINPPSDANDPSNEDPAADDEVITKPVVNPEDPEAPKIPVDIIVKPIDDNTVTVTIVNIPPEYTPASNTFVAKINEDTQVPGTNLVITIDEDDVPLAASISSPKTGESNVAFSLFGTGITMLFIGAINYVFMKKEQEM